VAKQLTATRGRPALDRNWQRRNRAGVTLSWPLRRPYASALAIPVGEFVSREADRDPKGISSASSTERCMSCQMAGVGTSLDTDELRLTASLGHHGRALVLGSDHGSP